MMIEYTTEIQRRIEDYYSQTRMEVQCTLKHTLRQVPSRALTGFIGIGYLVLATGIAAAAPDDVGNVYCDTGVETGIDLVFGAVAGLGLPATGYYMSKGGLSYMRAGGNPEKKNKAKERLVMSAIGFGIVVLALLSPELVDKIGTQMGFGFSDCVKPF